jgi:hypothetical protein
MSITANQLGNPNLGENYEKFLKKPNTVKVPSADYYPTLKLLEDYGASLILIPQQIGNGVLPTYLPNDGSADFTVTRNSIGTYFDRDGILRVAQPNQPRLDFDPITREYKGVLVEPAATNLFLHSEKFEEGVWLNSDVAGVRVFKFDNQAIAPNGTLTAGLIVPSSLPNTEHPMRYNNLSIPSSVFQNPFSWSIFVKPAGYNFFGLRTNVNNVWSLAMWNLQTGTPFSISNNYTNSFIQRLPNGWYRVGVTAPNSTIPSIQHISSPNGSISFTGNEVDGTYIWGAQLETGTVITSYIPTSGTTVPRGGGDSIQILNKSNVIGQSEGSNLKFFLNGELVGQQTSALIGNNFLSFFVGKLQTSASDINFNNGIKSSALFTRTLSDQEAINLTKLN